MTTLHDVQAAYQEGRRQAQVTTTVRLRYAERRIRRQQGQLTHAERAFHEALCDELRFRGIEVTG